MMPRQPENPESFVAENEDLRARLEKAEATLREILSGEADALFVTRESGGQLFAFKGADQSYRVLIENMSEGALTLTPDGLILYANRCFAEMLRVPLEKVIGSEIQTWFVPESRPGLQTLLQTDALDNLREELTLAAADGTQVPVYLSVSRIHQDEMPDSLCMVVTDLTLQKRDEKIIAAEKLVRTILEQADDAIVICDDAGHIIHASKQAKMFYNKDLNGHLFEHVFPLRQLDGTAFLPFDAVDPKYLHSVEAKLTHNGQELDFLVTVGHLIGAQNQLLGSVVTLTDITKLTTSELALRKSESHLSELLKIAGVAYWEYEVASDEFIFNDQYYALHKITAEEAGGYRMSSADFARRYVHPGDALKISQQIRLALEAADADYSAIVDARMLTGAGEIVWMEVRIRIEKDALGQTIRGEGIVQDITERKQSELTLRQKSDDLEEAQRVAHVGNWQLNVNTNAVTWSTETYRIFGRDPIQPAPALHEHVQIMRPNSLVQMNEAIEQARKTGKPFNLDLELVRPDSSTGWITVRGEIVRDELGRVAFLRGTAADITDRITAENILRDLEQLRLVEAAKQAAILNALPAHIALLDGQGRIVSVNETWRQFADMNALLSSEYGIGLNYLEICDNAYGNDAAEAEQAAAGIRSVLTGVVNHFSLEYPCHSLNEQRWFQLTVTPLANEHTDGVVVMHLNITERKQAEQEIKFKNTMLQIQQEVSLDAILVDDEDQKILSHNQQFLDLWQIPPQSLIEGMDTPLLGTAADKVENPDAFFAQVQYLYEQHGERSRDEIRMKDGRIIDCYSAPVSAADGKYYGRIWCFRDITERKRAVALLRESEQKLRAIFESANDGMVVAELVTGKIVSGNPAIFGMLGYTPEELSCLATSDLHPKQDLPLVVEAFRKLSQGDIRVSLDVRVIRKDGSIVYVDISAGALRVDDKDCVIGIFHDITERKQAQDEICKLNDELENKVAQRTAELEHARLEADHANRAKSDFLAAMSHEIRTPMNGVIGMIDVLQQSSLTEVQMDMAKVIHDSAYALLNVINDILDFTKIEAGKITLDSAPISLTEIMEGVGDMLVHTAFNKNVLLWVFVDPALHEQIIGDAGRLRQILVNLVGNAIKFSGGQARLGKVSLRARLLANAEQEILVEFSVTDNGIGIDEATQERLFTPFTQANSSTASKFGGTGLGLVITQRLVHLKGGEIILSSELGKGTEVRVSLPFNRLSQSPDASKQRYPLAGLNCLIMGFEEGFAGDLAAYLAHAGAQLQRVGDVDAARRWLSECSAGQYVLVLHHAVADSARENLRAMVRSRSNLKIGFVPKAGCVVIGGGERRRSRVAADDLVMLDGYNLHFSELVRAVGIAAGRIHPEIERQATPHIRKQATGQPSRETAIRQGSLILVVEDNEINQKVIVHQLRLLERVADVANNGREALEKWQSGEYGIVLTDLNMPLMTGWDLSAAIRAAEDGKSHIPIIALTANVLKGEADRCLERGMDDYLSKPVGLSNLKATLDKWLPLVGGDARIDSESHQANIATPVDVSVLKALVGDEEEIIRDFLHTFWLSAAEIRSDLHVACAAGEALVASGLMHKLKSSARTVGALALGELCAEMEAAGKAGSNEALALLLPMFEQELNAVNIFIESLLGQLADRHSDK